MATGEIVEPREIVKANNELFRCKYKIKDVVASRIFMAFASLVDHKDIKENQNFVEYRIAADSILPETCNGGDNYQQLKDAANSLLDQKIELRISKKEYYFYTLFSKIGYKNGIIIGEFHKDLMPFFIIARGKFTKLKFTEYMNLPSIYSQCIFGFLKSWSDKQEITVKTSELHEMLDTPQSFKRNFSEFKRSVLDKAHKDINERTSLHYEYEPIKNGRSFSEIKFKFIKNAKMRYIENSQAGKLLQAALGVEPKNTNSTNARNFELFLQKFPNHNASRFEAWKIWNKLNTQNKAPLAKDVPENNVLGVMEFLERWQDSCARANDNKNE